MTDTVTTPRASYIEAGAQLYEQFTQLGGLEVQDLSGYSGAAGIEVLGSHVTLVSKVLDMQTGQEGGRQIADFATFIGGIAYKAGTPASSEEILFLEQGVVLADLKAREKSQVKFITDQALVLASLSAQAKALRKYLEGVEA